MQKSTATDAVDKALHQLRDDHTLLINGGCELLFSMLFIFECGLHFIVNSKISTKTIIILVDLFILIAVLFLLDVIHTLRQEREIERHRVAALEAKVAQLEKELAHCQRALPFNQQHCQK